jgi:hypothetical protein
MKFCLAVLLARISASTPATESGVTMPFPVIEPEVKIILTGWVSGVVPGIAPPLPHRRNYPRHHDVLDGGAHFNNVYIVL